MIIEDYATFRILANPGGAIGVDGLPEWPVASMRANGFDDGFAVTSTSHLPFGIVVLGPNIPVVDPIDYFDWYVSQGTTDAAKKPFVVTRGLSDTGGRIIFSLSSRAAEEFPDPFDLSTIRVLYFGIDIYCIRRSDSAIQRFDLMKYLLDALAPKTDIG